MKSGLYTKTVLWCFLGVLLHGVGVPETRAQNVRIGTNDVGASYTIPVDSPPVFSDIAFTQSGATVIANSDSDWSGDVSMNADGTFRVGKASGSGGVPFTLTLEGAIRGSGKLTKTGDGTLVIYDASGFYGPWSIEDGTVVLDSDNNINAASEIVLETDATLDLGGTSQTIGSLSGNGKIASLITGQTLTIGGNNRDSGFAGTFEGDGGIEKTGGGTLILSGDNSATFTGTLTVSDGTLLVNGDFSGGAATAGSGAILGGTGVLQNVTIGTGGTLAPGDRSDGGSVGSTMTIDDDLEFESGSTLNLRFGVDGDGSGVTDSLNVTGNLTGLAGATLELEAAAGDYSKGVDFVADDFFNALSEADVLGAVFLQNGFLKIDPGAADDDNSFTVTRDMTYFTRQAETHNQREVAKALDRTNAPKLWNLLTALNGKDATPGALTGALNELSAAAKANSLTLGQWRTSRYGLNHLDLTPCGEQYDNSFWLEFIHQTTDLQRDGNNADHDVTRTGFLVGSEERYAETVLGMLVGYSEPYLRGNGNKIEASDLQFGFYGGTKPNDFSEVKLFIGVGGQKYDSHRVLRDPLLVKQGNRHDIKSSYSGNSLSMSLELAAPLQTGLFALRPVIAVDSDMTWQYGYREKGDTGYELSHSRAFYDRTFVRAGTTVQLGSVENTSTFTLLGRAFYEYQILGEAAPISQSRFAHDTSGAYRMETRGVDPGKSFVDLGLGFRWNIDDSRAFYGDYDFHFATRSTGHYASLGYMQRW